MRNNASVRAIARFIRWWAVLLALYLILISAVTVAELVTGAALAAVCALLAHLSRRALRPSSELPDFAWQKLLWLPLDMARDIWILTVYLARYPSPARRFTGTVSQISIAQVPGADAESRRAYGAFVVSLAPGGFVVDVELTDDGPDVMHVHQLGPSGRSARMVDP